jgi:hypothetical protein
MPRAAREAAARAYGTGRSLKPGRTCLAGDCRGCAGFRPPALARARRDLLASAGTARQLGERLTTGSAVTWRCCTSSPTIRAPTSPRRSPTTASWRCSSCCCSWPRSWDMRCTTASTCSARCWTPRWPSSPSSVIRSPRTSGPSTAAQRAWPSGSWGCVYGGLGIVQAVQTMLNFENIDVSFGEPPHRTRGTGLLNGLGVRAVRAVPAAIRLGPGRRKAVEVLTSRRRTVQADGRRAQGRALAGNHGKPPYVMEMPGPARPVILESTPAAPRRKQST